LIPTVPGTLDPDDPNNNRPKPTPEEQEVIDAYIETQQAANWLASHRPFDIDAARFVAAPYTARELTRVGRFIETRAQSGERLVIRQGLTFRPYVSVLGQSRATVLDCQLDGTYWVDANGTPRPADASFPGAPGEVVEFGVAFQLVLRRNEWLVDSSSAVEEACQ